MAGEMFAAGQHPGIPQAAGHGAAIIRDGLHSLPIITAFRRAGKSIQHRRTVQVNTQCPQLTAHHTPNFVGVGGIARAGNDHGAGKNRGFVAQAGNTAALLVDGAPAKEFIAANPGLKLLDTAYVEESYAIGIGKGNTELKDAINTALEELKADGTLQAIVDKYITAE